jgi:hypothetical protein
MNLYQSLKDIFDYIVLIKRLDNSVMLVQIEVPSTWQILKKFIDETTLVPQDNTQKNSNVKSLAFAIQFDGDKVNLLVENIIKIIAHNKEIEQKNLLFENKVEELKKVFSTKKLDELQNLRFEIINTGINE